MDFVHIPSVIHFCNLEIMYEYYVYVLTSVMHTILSSYFLSLFYLNNKNVMQQPGDKNAAQTVSYSTLASVPDVNFYSGCSAGQVKS